MKTLYLFLILLMVAFYTKGQNKVWKKQVSRVIDTRTLSDRIDHGDSPISNLIKNAVLSGKVTAYNRDDNDSFTKIAKQQFADIFDYSRDTISYADPQTAALTARVVYKGYYPDSVYMYRIIEEWSFNSATGKVFTQIKYIAPVRNVYSGDGRFLGTTVRFWLRYTDFYDMMRRFNAEPLLNHFIACTWYSNFTCDPSLMKQQPYTNILKTFWRCAATRTIDMQEPEDTVKHTLRNENSDTILSEQIITKVRNDLMPAWDGDAGFSEKPLVKEKLIAMITNKPDTEMIVENGPPREEYRVVYRDFDYTTIHKYSITETWSFHPLSGTTRIEMTGVALLKDMLNDKGKFPGTKRMFWVCYPDIQPIFKKIEEYYPTNTFAMHIWNNFFLSDTKPVIEISDAQQ